MYGALRKEADVLWRENLARLRMQDMENAIFKQQRVEKQKLFERELGDGTTYGFVYAELRYDRSLFCFCRARAGSG